MELTWSEGTCFYVCVLVVKQVPQVPVPSHESCMLREKSAHRGLSIFLSSESRHAGIPTRASLSAAGSSEEAGIRAL